MSVMVKLLAGLTALAVMGTVTISDPTGDAVGDGTIVAPTAPRYANSAIFDLQDVSLERRHGAATGSIVLLPAGSPAGSPGEGDAGSPDAADDSAGGEVGADQRDGPAAGTTELGWLDGGGSVVRVTLGAIELSESTALGFGSVVIDLYLDGAPGGRQVTLDGPGMLLPSGRGWEYAVRLTPDGATGYRYVAPDEADGAAVPVDPSTDVTQANEGVEAGAESGQRNEPTAAFEHVPVGVTLQGARLSVETPWDFPGEVMIYALTGVHDPFNPTGWRPLADAPSPWAYSGGEQVVPVIDLLAPNQGAQEHALRTGILPLPLAPGRDAGALWLVLMAVGLAVAAAGLVLRRRVPGAAERPLKTGLPPQPPSEAPTSVPGPVFAVPPAPAVGQAAEPQVREKPRPPDPELADPSEAAGSQVHPDAEPAWSGVSAFDSYVLLEATAEDEPDAEGFDELTRAAARVAPPSTVTGSVTPAKADGDRSPAASSDERT